jgi:hypothetical protein
LQLDNNELLIYSQLNLPNETLCAPVIDPATATILKGAITAAGEIALKSGGEIYKETRNVGREIMGMPGVNGLKDENAKHSENFNYPSNYNKPTRASY